MTPDEPDLPLSMTVLERVAEKKQIDTLELPSLTTLSIRTHLMRCMHPNQLEYTVPAP
ncbi:hypothetical protein ACFQJ8_27955 [Halocatena marina]|uniref:hypothetical protein n=1 Tax=Halocatena marina TaxID=2934937 RepID=UPI00361E0AAF